MRAKQNENGEFEITVPVTFIFDPTAVGFELSVYDLRAEVEIALSRIQHAAHAKMADEA